jgi:hypothetical protein
MAISQTQIVDYLLKKVGYGVAKTDTSTAKGPSNESNASPLLSPGSTIWQQDFLIPSVTTLPSANSAVVTVYRDSLSTTVQSVNLAESTTNQTWATNLTNWIPTQYGAGYQLQVYAAPSGNSAPQTYGVSLPQAGSGNNDSWYFDYQAGILNFADTNVPSAVTWNGSTGNVVYMVGARYTGQSGITTFASPITFNNVVTHNGFLYANNAQANGNVQVGGNLNVTGNINNILSNVYTQGGIFYGMPVTGMNALYAGQSSFTPLANTVVQVSGNINNFAQINNQNSNSGAQASTDYVATANNGNQNDTYIDMGINSSGYNQPAYGLQSANDGYLYVAGNTTTGGGNLVLSTTTLNDIIFSLGGIATENEFVRMRANTNSFVISSTTNASNTTSGSFYTLGGAGIVGNLYAGNISTLGNVTANYYYGNGYTLTGVNLYGNAQVAAYLPVYGGNIGAYNINANLITNNIYATSYNPNINLDPAYQGIVAVNSNTAVLMPVGNSSNYPTYSIAGMMRWNTDLSYMEVYNGTQWTAVETGAGAGLITSDVFTGNGSQTQFTLSQNNTTQGTLVSINGVIQIPTISYSVSGNVLTMTEPPVSTDIIEARSVTAISQVAAIKNGNAELLATTINGVPTVEVLINGLDTFSVDNANTNVYNTLQLSNAIVANINPTTVNNTTLALDSFSTSLYRTAKYIVSASNTGSGYYQSLEAIVTQSGSTANIVVTANGIIGSSIVTLTANVSGGLAKLWATTTTSGNNIKIIQTYIPV